MESSRPTWDETWFAVAHDVAKRSLCTRDKVGAVIVSATNRIIATGYNGPPTGFQHGERPCTAWCQRALGAGLDATYNDCPSLHAEANALSVCDRSVREGGMIYVTSHSCMGCAKLIANSGLTTVNVMPGINASHRNPTGVYEFLDRCGITVYVS